MISIIMLDLFSKLSPQDRRLVGASTRQHIFHQGEKSYGIGFVSSGAVELVRHTEAGIAIKVSSAKAQESFAEASIFSEVYHCDCVATEPSQVVLFRASAIKNLLQYDPDFALDFTKLLARQIRKGRLEKEILAIKSAEKRVLAALAEGWMTGTVMDFAAQVGLTHEVVYRTLNKLENKGRVRKLGRGKYSLLAITPAA